MYFMKFSIHVLEENSFKSEDFWKQELQKEKRTRAFMILAQLRASCTANELNTALYQSTLLNVLISMCTQIIKSHIYGICTDNKTESF